MTERHLIRVSVGERYPFPIKHQGEGMLVHISPTDTVPDIKFVVRLSRPLPSEIEALTKTPIKIGIVGAPPLVWFTLQGDRINFDAPYALGIEPKAREIVESFQLVEMASPETRILTDLVTLDAENNIVRGIRTISFTRQWFQVLRRHLLSCPVSLTQTTYNLAVEGDMRKYPTTKALVKAATIIERGGL